VSRRVRRRILGILGAFVLVCTYIAVRGAAPVAALSTRRWDKFWQLLLLVPAVLVLSLAVSGWVRRDLAAYLSRATRRIGPVVLVLVGFCLLVLVAYGPLGHMPRSRDEAEYLFQGRILMSGNVTAPAPPCDDAFDLRGILVRDGRWFAAYDPGHPLVLGIADRLNLAWLVGPLLGGISLWLLYVLGRDVYGPGVARGAVALGIVSPFFVLLAASHSYHVSSLVLTAAFFVCAARRGRHPVWDCLAGCALGGLVLVRPLGLIILLPSLVVLEAHRWRVSRGPLLREWARILAGFLPLVFLYLAYNWRLTGHPLVSGRQILYPTSLFGFGVEAAHGPSYGSVGHTPLKGLMNVGLQLGTLSTGLLGWPLVSLVPALIALVLGPRRVWDWVFSLMVVSTAGVLFFSWYSAVEHGPRHYLDAWPGLILLSALGFVRMWNRVGSARPRRNAMVLTIGGLFVLSTLLYVPVRVHEALRPWLGVDPKVGRVVSEQVEAPALVFMEFPDAPADYYTSGFVHNDPFLRAPVIYARHRSIVEDRQCLTRFPGRQGYLLRYDPASRRVSLSPLATSKGSRSFGS
jgi:4-amino-4-deoxy-L-arabinose transferase-like glycosyltransferase